METYSSSNVTAPDPKERVLYYTQGKNMAAEQLLKLKHKGITSASDKRKMTGVPVYPITFGGLSIVLSEY